MGTFLRHIVHFCCHKSLCQRSWKLHSSNWKVIHSSHVKIHCTWTAREKSCWSSSVTSDGRTCVSWVTLLSTSHQHRTSIQPSMKTTIIFYLIKLLTTNVINATLGCHNRKHHFCHFFQAVITTLQTECKYDDQRNHFITSLWQTGRSKM